MPDSLTVRDGELNTADVVVRGVRQIRTRPGWLSKEIGGTAVFGDPTDRWNAITDLGMSGDPRLYETSVNIPSGATSVTLTGTTKELANGFPDTYPLSIYPLPIPTYQTFKVGQDIRIPDGKAANVDLIATITAVINNTLHFTPATSNTNSIDFIQHDDTRVLQEFLDTFLEGYIYFPEGFYPISSHQAWVTGKDYAIQLPATSEALNRQFVFQGLGKYRSGFLHTGDGHAFKLKNTSINNLVFCDLHCSHANRYQLQTPELETAGAAIYLDSDQFTTEGVPQTGATACLIERNHFIGWKYGVFGCNLQSSEINQNSFYFCMNAITCAATGNIRGIGSQTEPNANQFLRNFIQYSKVLATNNGRIVTDAVTIAAHDTGGASTGHNASNVVTSATANFQSTDLYRLVKIEGASVNQTEHRAIITKVNSSTSVNLSQAPWIENTGLTMKLYPRSIAHIYLNNASNVEIVGGTWQGNWLDVQATDELHALLVEHSDEITMDGIWIEGNGGPAGSAVRFTSVRGARVLNSNFGANGFSGGAVGYGTGLYLDNVIGCRVDGCYIAATGVGTDAEIRNGTRGVFVDNSTVTSATNWMDSNTGDTTQNMWPVQFGLGVRFLFSGGTDGTYSTELLHDSLYARNLLTNGNFQETLVGWVQDAPGALAVTNTGTARGLRYLTITPTLLGAGAYSNQIHQIYNIPDSVQQYQSIALGFDWRIESRGADAIATVPTYNEMRVKVIYSTGETLQFTVNPSAANGRILQRWHRSQILSRIPNSAVGRTVSVYIECGTGANAAVFRVANLKLVYSLHATYDDDEVITELQGGNLSAPMRWIDQATPSNPAAGSIKIYSKGGAPTYLTSAGAENTLVASGSLSNVVYNNQANTWTTGNQQFNDLRILPTSGTFYLRVVPTGAYTATRTLTLQLNDGSRTLSMAGNVTFSAAATFNSALTLTNTTGAISLGSGSNTLTIATTGNTSVTLPTSGTLVGSNDTSLFINGLTALGVLGGYLEVGNGFTANGVVIQGGGSNNFQIDSAGNIVLGAAALATTATDGFVFIPGGSGPPTGVPSITPTGCYPMYYDATNDKLYIRRGGTWRSTTLT